MVDVESRTHDCKTRSSLLMASWRCVEPEFPARSGMAELGYSFLDARLNMTVVVVKG